MPDTDKTMLRLQQGNQVFNLRAAAVVIHEGYVLAHRADTDPFWTMPGGRVQMGETGAEALLREMHEEVGLDVTVERLLFVAEEYFDSQNRNRHHEIGLYYAVHLPADAVLLDKGRIHEGVEDGSLDPIRLEFRWFPLEELATLEQPLYPAFLRTRLTSLGNGVQHVIRVDED
jgi:ADP-ribose pyrophosphatase YjhB (NUDIX family)